MSATCPVCAGPVSDDARFCESCGAPMVAGTEPGAPTWGVMPDWGYSSASGSSGSSGSLGFVRETAAQARRGERVRRGSKPDQSADWFFESMGAAAAPADLETATIRVVQRVPCPACGGDMAEDGYCTQCGQKRVAKRDHWVRRPADWVAGICDRGIRHPRNEDAMALAADREPGSFAVLVVCDGVSSARDSDVASLAAARAARDLLASRGPSGPNPVTGEVVERMATWSNLLDVAAQAANDAIVASATTPSAPAPSGTRVYSGDSPPSCTYIAAVVDHPMVVVGWLGDSRAYWLPDRGQASQLSVDDSWAQEMVTLGLSRAAAEAMPQAHAITRWLGPDTESTDAQTAATFPAEPGWLLVCSDGLWNYCSPAADLRDLVGRTRDEVGQDPAALAEALVAWANAQGGHDNVTVALARLDGAEPGEFDTVRSDDDAVPGDDHSEQEEQ